MNWAGQALARLEADPAVALVSVIGVQGSTPREVGARMLVGEGWMSGTIGGGNLEYLAADQARRLLAQTERDYAMQDYPLGPLLAQCCGGRVRVLLERMDARSRPWLRQVDRAYRSGRTFDFAAEFAGTRLKRSVILAETQWPGVLAAPVVHMILREERGAGGRRPMPRDGDVLMERIDARLPRLALFGAGHVGLAVARQFAALSFDLDHYDIRPEAEGPQVTIVSQSAMLAAAADASTDFVLIMTHNHELDYQLVRAVLGEAGSGYCGLIGSATKRARFLRRLHIDGAPQSAIARLVCPIGIPGLKSKAPEVIAVSVAADLLQRVEASADGR